MWHNDNNIQLADPNSGWNMSVWTKANAGFFGLLALGLIYALPVFFDGRYYLDDLPHAMNGLTLWEQDGRPMASILSSLISFSWPSFSQPALYDTSPLPQLLGLLALTYGAARLAQRLFPKGVGVAQLLVVFPVIGSPFMLQNLSYKYDAFTMGLAVMLALCAATLEASPLVALLVVLALLLYQAAFNVFVAACAMVWLASSLNEASNDRDFVRKLLWGFAALVAYGLGMKFLGGLTGDYATQHSAIISPGVEGLRTLAFNAGFVGYMASEVVPYPLVSAALIIILVALFAVRNSDAKHGMVRVLLTFVICAGSVAGILVLLQAPVVRPRTLMGFSVLLVFLVYAVHEMLKRWPGFQAAALGLVIAWFFVNASIYANAARDETRFDGYLTANIIGDLAKAGFVPGHHLAFDGVQPFSPLAARARNLKLMARLLQPNMNGNSEWGFRQLEFYGFATTPVMNANDESLKAICGTAPLVRTPLYQIFKNTDATLVAFPHGNCFKD